MPSRSKKKVKNADGTWSKRPVKQPIVKRKQVEDGDGWTHVIGPHQHKIRETTDTDVVYIKRNPEEMSAQHEKMLKRWQESDTRKTLATEIIEFERSSNVKIKKIVCLGLGTLSNGNFTQQNNRHAQLAALMDVIALLGGSNQLTMVAQDPVFGPCDKSFLDSLGFQILENPGAIETIDRDTLVFAIHCHVEIYEEIAQVNRPAIIIGNDIEELCDSRDVSESLKLLANSYKEISVEPVLSKRKERADYFDQIFYSAFYATRLYLHTPSASHEFLHDVVSLTESFPTKIRGGAKSSEYDPILAETPGQVLELVDNEEISSEESNAPIAEGRNPPFEIYEDVEGPPESSQPSNSSPMPPTPVIEEDPEVLEDIPEPNEPAGSPPPPSTPEIEEDPEVEESSELEEDPEENKENYPPPDEGLSDADEMAGRGTRRTQQDFVNKYAYQILERI